MFSILVSAKTAFPCSHGEKTKKNYILSFRKPNFCNRPSNRSSWSYIKTTNNFTEQFTSEPSGPDEKSLSKGLIIATFIWTCPELLLELRPNDPLQQEPHLPSGLKGDVPSSNSKDTLHRQVNS